ncbi:MAG: thioredoxin domain-containing protein [Candidatus Helarchaeota archaeon]
MASNYVIKKQALIHCARGPRWCSKCREMAQQKKFCLLEIFIESGKVTRPMTELIIDGKKQLYEYNVAKIFNSEREAKEYAKKNDLEIIY